MWNLVWIGLAWIGLYVAVFLPEYFPELFTNKYSSFWNYSTDPVLSNSVGLEYRNPGIYSSYLECGNVFVFGFILLLSKYVKREQFNLTNILIFSLMCLLVLGIFFVNARTPMIMVLICVTIVFINGLKYLRRKTILKKYVFALLVCVIFWQLTSSFLSVQSINLSGRIAMMKNVLGIQRIMSDSSFQGTIQQLFLPDKPLIFLIGNGEQPFFSYSGVRI